jgi:hypothetical protein
VPSRNPSCRGRSTDPSAGLNTVTGPVRTSRSAHLTVTLTTCCVRGTATLRSAIAMLGDAVS